MLLLSHQIRRLKLIPALVLRTVRYLRGADLYQREYVEKFQWSDF